MIFEPLPTRSNNAVLCWLLPLDGGTAGGGLVVARNGRGGCEEAFRRRSSRGESNRMRGYSFPRPSTVREPFVPCKMTVSVVVVVMTMVMVVVMAW